MKRALLILTGLLASLPAMALATSHALIMTLDYSGTQAALPGIALDAQMAREIAQNLGVPAANIRQPTNKDLSSTGMRRQLQGLLAAITPGDQVFIYYSGHGMQVPNKIAGGNRCSEAMVGAELSPFPDIELEQVLQQLANKASAVLMLNDSCFSGGQTTRPLGSVLPDGALAKSLPWQVGSANAVGYVCGAAVNNSAWSKVFSYLQPNVADAPAKIPARLLYLAAARDNEVAYATSKGSRATRAWHQCLHRPPINGMSAMSGNDLMRCAQPKLDAQGDFGSEQNISLLGDGRLRFSFKTEE